ncbi:MAG: hypothetical protein FWE82_03125 [Defluviitaleaceae bacterium]|nr:hypothetical protein [Defluviitaleaceae bacterium]
MKKMSGKIYFEFGGNYVYIRRQATRKNPKPDGFFYYADRFCADDPDRFAAEVLAAENFPPLEKNCRVYAAVNLPQTAVRFAEVPPGTDPSEIHGTLFPFGKFFCGDTHMISQAALSKKYFCFAALPVAMSNIINSACEKIFGGGSKLVCIDTIEHQISRRYAGKNGNFFVLQRYCGCKPLDGSKPQNGGYRAVSFHNGVPVETYRIDGFNLGLELDRLFASLTAEQIPDEAIIIKEPDFFSFDEKNYGLLQKKLCDAGIGVSEDENARNYFSGSLF